MPKFTLKYTGDSYVWLKFKNEIAALKAENSELLEQISQLRAENEQLRYVLDDKKIR